MISIVTNDLKSIIEIEVDGKITSDEIKDFESYLKGQKEKVTGRLNLLLVIKDLDYTIDGFLADLKFETLHFNDFNKVAIVSDKKWIEIGTKMSDILPTVEIKHFDKDEKDKANMWLK